MDHESQVYRYRIDDADVIVWVDRLWLAFAQENGARQLCEETVLGRPLWDFISGDVTRRLFCEIHGRVRMSHKPAILPFRCDSPSVKRQMRLKITEESGELLYESVMLRAEPQVALSTLDLQQPRSNCVLTLCSCCKRALLETVGWLDLEDVSARLRLFEMREVPILKYTVCPECTDMMEHSVDNGHAA